MSTATNLVYTSRRAGLSRQAPWAYTLHRPECAMAATAKPLADRHDAEQIIRKARTGLNAKACSLCKPDVSA
jgi:hypothetical protein